MSWGITYICAAIVGVILSLYAFQKKDILGFRFFAAFAFFQSIWSLGYGLEILLPGYATKVLVAKIQYVSIVFAPVLWLVFSLSYTKFEKWISTRRIVFLSIVPIITLTFVATNELHGLIWSNLYLFDAGFGFEMMDFSYGPWFWVHMSYTYLLVAISFIHLAARMFASSEHYKKQIMYLMICGLCPFFFNIVYIFDSGFLYDLTPLGYMVSIILIMWGLFFNRIYNLKSTAREAVLELMQDAVIVIDEHENVLDLNQSAISMLQNLKINDTLADNQNSIYGSHIDSVFPITNHLRSSESQKDSTGQAPQHTQHGTLGVSEFAKIHVDLQNRLEAQLQKNLSKNLNKTDNGLEIHHQISQIDESQPYSLEIAQGDQYYNVRVSSFSSALKQQGRVLVIQNISSQKEQDELMEEMIFFDKLTNLYNRYSFMQYGKLLLRQNSSVSLLVLDLDRFKNVNDSLGHKVGDDLLVQVSKRLKNVVGESDTLARLGADEFAILTSEQEFSKVKGIAEDILIAFRSPFGLQGQVVHMHASIGIATAKSDINNSAQPTGLVDTTDIEYLLRHADIAMYEAKQQGLGYSIYSSKETVNSLRNLNLETELMQAIEQSEFRLFYQPIVQAHNGALVGFEALLRWKKGEEYVGPAQFLSFAEEIGKMKLIDYWVLERVLTHDRSMLPAGFIALNLSGATLRDTGVVDLAKALIAKGHSAEGIVLEVTESTMMNVSIATSILNELKSLGFQIAIDDFGTGYSSLKYIEQFPLDILKIDKSFISGIGKSTVSEALLRTIINLGQNLGVVVLAEGVETPEQYKWLIENDCLYLQGHLFGWPKPTDHYNNGFAPLTIESFVEKPEGTNSRNTVVDNVKPDLVLAEHDLSNHQNAQPKPNSISK